MRLCPSVEGSASPLITHRIGVEVCLARQDANFHKCHRCIYRGQSSTWEPESPPLMTVNVHAAEETRGFEVKTIEIPRPAKKAPVVAAKPAAKKPAQAAS